jgi:hypothetical protein
MRRFLPVTLLLFAGCTLWAQPQRLKLTPYRQAERSFHPLTDPALPAALKAASRDARASDGASWRGTDEGLWREDPKAPALDRKRYFASKRWLPDDKVRSVHPDSSGGVWVLTETGAAHITFARTTLAAKTKIFEQRVQERHNRHGMVASSSFTEPGNPASNRVVTSDNDGLWTAMYAAAECFRYAVTKSDEALRYATKATEAVLKLEQITGRPGLPARSYLLPSEPRPREGVWFPVPDGSLIWKGDTSSDEIVGHYLIFALAFDLLPDKGLRQRVVDTTRRMTDHILHNGLTLTDLHGRATWWGRWDAEYFASERGNSDSPLNALEILSFLKTAHHITGEARYDREYRRLALQEGYADRTTRYRELREVINYSDEELAMLSFYPLLVYEKDPKLRSFYVRALDDWWSNMPRQKNPLWTFIYAAGNPAGKVNLPHAVWTLQRIPTDLITWTIRNSNRTDIEWEQKTDRFGRRQALTLLPADERPVMKWNGNPFQVDGGSGGRGEDDGAFFLLPYWMGRHHSLILGE